METESELNLKRVYGAQLRSLLTLQVECSSNYQFDIRAATYFDFIIFQSKGKLVRWLTRIVRTVASYTPYRDHQGEIFRLEILRNLDYVIGEVGEAVQVHARDILELLIRLIYDLSKDVARNEELFQLGSACLLKTAKLAPEEFRALFSGMEEEKINPVFDEIFRITLTAL